MSSVDSRIVTMKFDNAEFQRGASTTMSTLDKLKASLNFTSTSSMVTKGLSAITGSLNKIGVTNPLAKTTQGVADLQAQTNRFSMGPITGGITEVSKGFIAMSTIAITALSSITSSAIAAGKNLVSSLTVSPIKQGLEEYETTLNSVQTILANTGLEGQKGLDTVNAALQQLNTYSDKTIYNFSQMARNIGTFTAAGVDLDVSVSAIKGIANLAAISGSSADQASTAMYQLSQALATGSVKLMDWNSIVNAGMGGKVFQEALKETARVQGVAVDDIIKKNGSFRDSLQEGWLTSGILTETLSKFTGDLTAQQLKTMGYNEAQIKGILKMGQTAQDAATKVKTVSQLISTLQEAAGSGWAKTWQLLFGDFGQAKELFTNVNNVLGGLIGKSAAARNKVLGDWSKRGGRDLLIDSISNAWNAFLDVLKPIKEAFRDIFPAKTGEDLYNLTVRLHDFTENLSISDETADKLRRTFAGVFAIFHIIGQVIGAVVGALGDLIGAVTKNSGGFLDFTAGIGDNLVAFDKFLEKSGVLQGFFSTIGSFVSTAIAFLRKFANIVSNLFGGFDIAGADKAGEAFDKFGEKVKPLTKVIDFIHSAFKNIGSFISGIGEKIGHALGGLGDAVAGAISPHTFDRSLNLINTALLGGIVLLIKNFLKGGVQVNTNIGIFANVREVLGQMTSTLKTMQQSVKADVILKIAVALGIMVASLAVLAMINPQDLVKALVGMAAGLAIMGAMMLYMSKSLTIIGAAKIMGISLALIGLATAMLILAAAVRLMQSMELGDMLRGIAGIGLMLVILNKSMSAMSKNVGGMVRVGASLILVGIALNLIALAVKVFATMKWEELVKGFAGVAGGLVAIAGAMQLMPKNMLLQSAGLILVGIALNIIAASMKIFATMDWEEIGKGLAGIAGALLSIAGAMQLMPANMLISAAALVVVGIALGIISGVMKVFATMNWEEIAKGLVGIAGALLVLAGGLTLMSGAIPGAIALVIAAGALAILTPILITLGSLDWMTIIKGLAALAGIFLVLGVAGLVLAPITPILIGLGLALVLVGAGLALAGVGALAFATAFGILVGVGSAGVKVLDAIFHTIINNIPALLEAFARGIVKFVMIITKHIPEFVAALGKLISALLQLIIQKAPEAGTAMLVLINTALRVIDNAVPRIIASGFRLIIAFLNEVSKNVTKITRIATDIIVKFIAAISKSLPRIVNAAIRMIIAFINALADAIDAHASDLGAATGRLGVALIEGVIKGMASMAGAIVGELKSLLGNAMDEAKNFLHIGSPSGLFRDEIGKPIGRGIAFGIEDFGPQVAEAAVGLGKTALSTLKKSMSGLSNALDAEIDINPTIAPVLDLTQMTREARKMSAILKTKPIMATVSYRRAVDISAETRAAQAAMLVSTESPVQREIKFEQTNISPKALSAIEIYRQTRNQLSLAREALSA